MSARRPSPGTIGARIARALHGAWRRDPPPIDLTPIQLLPCVDAIVRSGAGALVWRRLRETGWRTARPLDGLRRAHHTDRLRAEVNERHVASVIAGMRDAGIDAILLKGWSVAGCYAEPALRPLGDIDLLVRTRDADRAAARAAELALGRPHIDLHTALLDLTDRTVPELFERSRMIPIGTASVRVLGHEDQLRHLCLHFFRHAGSRPLWLCDIAAMLETMPDDFEWDRCLAGDALLSERVVAAVGLAEHLLGARPRLPVPSASAQRLPAWLPSAVLKSWGAPFDGRVFQPTTMALALGTPADILPTLLRRWPNPLEATVQRAARLTGMWRPVIQVHEAGIRATRYLRALAGRDWARTSA